MSFVMKTEPLHLIPNPDGVIGRLIITATVDSAATIDPLDLYQGFSFADKTGDVFYDEPVMMQARRSAANEEDEVKITFVAAVFFGPDKEHWEAVVSFDTRRLTPEAQAALGIEEGTNLLQSCECGFPVVLFYDFNVATETAMNPLRYDAWRAQNLVKAAQLKQQKQKTFALNPVFSIIVPLFETPLNFLTDMVTSVQKQSYESWELILVNASPENSQLKAAVASYAAADRRIKTIEMQNEGIAGNTNAGIRVATGEFIGFMDHDDAVEPDLLFEYVTALNKQPEIDFFYCDEDLFNNEGKYFDPLFKPDFNLDLLRTHNYITHFHVVRKSLLDMLELSPSELDGAQDYDLTFKACEKARVIKHVPRVLYHWRAHEKSTNIEPGSKPYAEEAGRITIQNHLDRTSPGATVRTSDLTNVYVVDYPVVDNPTVSVIIPNKDQPAFLRRAVTSLLANAGYEHLEIVIVENNSTTRATRELYEELCALDSRIKVATFEERGFNYSKLINFGVEQATGDYLMFLNNDTEAITPSCVKRLLANAQRSEVGVVGARLLFPDNTVQHAGVVVQFEDDDFEPAFHLFKDLPRGNNGYHDRAIKTQSYSVVTGACQMVSKEIFTELGGYNEDLAVAFNDVDFCLKARRAGYLVTYCAEVTFYHYESVSRGSDQENSAKQQRAEQEKALMFKLWKNDYAAGDPYYNRNFDQTNAYCSLDYGKSAATKFFNFKRRVHHRLIVSKGV